MNYPRTLSLMGMRLLVLGLGALAGCSWTDKNGTHHLIVGLGFGVVTTTNMPGVDVWDSRVLGALAGPNGASVGWMQQHRLAIDPLRASNVVISIKATPCSLTVRNFDFRQTNVTENTPNKERTKKR
jgi:hypothetical protein